MRINVMKSGDKVLNVTHDFVAIERISGEVDVIPFAISDTGPILDVEHITTIGYGVNSIQAETVDGITITNF